MWFSRKPKPATYKLKADGVGRVIVVGAKPERVVDPSTSTITVTVPPAVSDRKSWSLYRVGSVARFEPPVPRRSSRNAGTQTISNVVAGGGISQISNVRGDVRIGGGKVEITEPQLPIVYVTVPSETVQVGES